MRVAIANEAASKLQKMYRGELNKRWWRAYKFSVYTAKAIRIQRTWRGHSGRKQAYEHRAKLEGQVSTCKTLIVVISLLMWLSICYFFGLRLNIFIISWSWIDKANWSATCTHIRAVRAKRHWWAHRRLNVLLRFLLCIYATTSSTALPCR